MAVLCSVLPLCPAASAQGDGLVDSGIDYTELVGTVRTPGAGYTSTLAFRCKPGETKAYNPTGDLTLLFVVFTSVFFNRTRAGLSYKSVGEHPQAAATLGINVIGVKYIACMICGALAGMGGAYLTTCYSSTYTDGIVAGRGFIALAAVIFGRWSAGGILLACLFFGFCDALQIRLQVSGIGIPYQFFQMIPYVATVVVLSLIGTKQAGPKANGAPYRREQR